MSLIRYLPITVWLIMMFHLKLNLSTAVSSQGSELIDVRCSNRGSSSTAAIEVLEHIANVGEDIEDEMRRIMKMNSRNSNSLVAQELYAHLTDKYGAKQWMVIVFNAVRRLHSNVLTGSTSCHVVFREGSKNAIAFRLNGDQLMRGTRRSGTSHIRPLGINREAMVCKGFADTCDRSGRILMTLFSSSLLTWKHPINVNGRITSVESILDSICWHSFCFWFFLWDVPAPCHFLLYSLQWMSTWMLQLWWDTVFISKSPSYSINCIVRLCNKLIRICQSKESE